MQYKKKEISLEKALKKEYITLEDAMMKASNSFYNEDHTFMKFRFLNNENNFYVTFKKDWNENPKVIFSK